MRYSVGMSNASTIINSGLLSIVLPGNTTLSQRAQAVNGWSFPTSPPRGPLSSFPTSHAVMGAQMTVPLPSRARTSRATSTGPAASAAIHFLIMCPQGSCPPTPVSSILPCPCLYPTMSTLIRIVSAPSQSETLIFPFCS